MSELRSPPFPCSPPGAGSAEAGLRRAEGIVERGSRCSSSTFGSGLRRCPSAAGQGLSPRPPCPVPGAARTRTASWRHSGAGRARGPGGGAGRWRQTPRDRLLAAALPRRRRAEPGPQGAGPRAEPPAEPQPCPAQRPRLPPRLPRAPRNSAAGRPGAAAGSVSVSSENGGLQFPSRTGSPEIRSPAEGSRERKP